MVKGSFKIVEEVSGCKGNYSNDFELLNIDEPIASLLVVQ